jgi:hypothetical protein
MNQMKIKNSILLKMKQNKMKIKDKIKLCNNSINKMLD